MTSPIHDPKNRELLGRGANPSTRPRIWVEGQQQPKFDLRAWTKVSMAITCRTLGPGMAKTATGIDHYGQSVLRGDRVPNLAWAGRAGKFIPSHQLTGAVITGSAQLLADAKQVVLPEPLDDEPIAYPNLIRPSFAATPEQPSRPQRSPALDVAFVAAATMPPGSDTSAHALADEPTLRAIRSLIGETDAAASERPARPPKHTTLPPLAVPIPPEPTLLQTIQSAGKRLIWGCSVQMLAWTLVGLAFPIGAVKATVFHLNGGDLREWT
ncbi:MAG: hypothetical protein ABIV25_08650 [Paracoccaceae bacterium]